MRNINSQSVLIVSPFFYPEAISTGKYNTFLAEALRDAGHQVTVLCSYPLYPEWKPSPTDESLLNIEIKRGGLKVKYPKSTILRRLYLEIWFGFFVRQTLKKDLGRYTRVVVILPPNIASLAIKRQYKQQSIPIIGIVHDLQGILIASQQGLMRKLIFNAVRMLEQAALNSADRLIFLSEQMREEAQTLYASSTFQSEVAYPFISLAQDSADSNTNYFDNQKYNIVYSGALGEKQNPQGLAELFKALAAEDQFECHIFSAGPVFETIKSQFQQSGIHFNPLVPAEELASLIRSSDLQVVPQVFDTSDGAFPSKVPNIIKLNTPLLCITPEHGELHQLLSESDRALLCDSWDIEHIKQHTVNFLTTDRKSAHYESELLRKFDVNTVIEGIVR